MGQTKPAYDLDPNLTRISHSREHSYCSRRVIVLTRIVDKVFKGIARLVAPKTLEEALTGFEEGVEGGEQDEAESGGGDRVKDEEPEIVGVGFEGKGCGLETRQRCINIRA
jgi:hypothetical protein